MRSRWVIAEVSCGVYLSVVLASPVRAQRNLKPRPAPPDAAAQKKSHTLAPVPAPKQAMARDDYPTAEKMLHEAAAAAKSYVKDRLERGQSEGAPCA